MPRKYGKILPIGHRKCGCSCVGTRKEKMENWVVVDYQCNYSYFHYPKGGYKPSDYSSLRCVNCYGVWRAKGAYVDSLKRSPSSDANRAEWDRREKIRKEEENEKI